MFLLLDQGLWTSSVGPHDVCLEGISSLGGPVAVWALVSKVLNVGLDVALHVEPHL